MITPLFEDRFEAGKRLAGRLSAYVDNPDVIVLALPRGGVPVASEVARALNAPLDVILVRKLGVPGQKELAMGAISSGGIRIMNEDVMRSLHIPDKEIEAVVYAENLELERRERAYRGERPELGLRDRIVILVDDGLATGSTMRAAVAAVRVRRPARIVVAVPVAPPEVCTEFKAGTEEVVCLETPPAFHAVGLWYEDFSQITDEEVQTLLERVPKALPVG
jgi:putative phosphoribosyl transferase